jgi:hypothetical protein
MKIAIMQPTYLPWLGYFSLMRSVDKFVILDSVQFEKRSWQQRNQIKTANGPLMLTIPVLTKGLGNQLMTEVVIDNEGAFPKAHTKSIALNYSRAKHFAEYAPDILGLLENRQEKLVDLTTEIILHLRDILGITTSIVYASELLADGKKAELLANICEELGASEYVSPPGSRNYLDGTDVFKCRGISYRYFEYEHPVYPQLYGEFLPYMSAIDAIFNCGRESAALL